LFFVRAPHQGTPTERRQSLGGTGVKVEEVCRKMGIIDATFTFGRKNLEV